MDVHQEIKDNVQKSLLYDHNNFSSLWLFKVLKSYNSITGSIFIYTNYTDSDLQVYITDYLLSQCFFHLQQPNGIFMMTRTAQLGGVETSK